MPRKPPPLTLARIATDIIHGTQLPNLVLPENVVLRVLKTASAGKTEVLPSQTLAGVSLDGQTIPRETAEALAQRISDAWGTIKSFDSTGTVTIQENADGHWYAIWQDHAGVVIAESTPVTTADQASKLVAWMRDNAAAAPEEVVDGKYAEHLERAATAPTEPPPGLEHLAAPTEDEDIQALFGILDRLGFHAVRRAAGAWRTQHQLDEYRAAGQMHDDITDAITTHLEASDVDG